MSRETHTRLPDDPAYWDRLAERSLRAAFHEEHTPWWSVLSDWSFAFAASAVLVLVGATLLPSQRSAPAAGDPVAEGLLTNSAPPAESVLLRLLAMQEAAR